MKFTCDYPKIAGRKLFFWIPAFAGMTLRGFKISPNGCHSRVGGDPVLI